MKMRCFLLKKMQKQHVFYKKLIKIAKIILILKHFMYNNNVRGHNP